MSDEAILFWATLTATLLVAAAMVIVVLIGRREEKEASVRFREVLARRSDMAWMRVAPEPDKGSALFDKLTDTAEVERDLRRAGLGSERGMRVFKLALFLVPLLGAGLGVSLGLARGMHGSALLLSGFAGFAIGYLVPPRVVRMLAARRQKRIREEMVPLLHMLRMLFDAGLSLEQTLRILHQDGGELIPEIAAELRVAVTRIGAGQDRAEALQDMVAPLDVAELNDTVAILKQATRYGGSLRESLGSFAALIEERRLSGLREYVSKLSAKMTIVMILFMFPALLIFIAGPGMITLVRALSSIR
ncbi:type II secretion system F family protein [Thauera sp.]|uniref:type II secretion system F family protein n=1 Tax=Thauera sp. TaxID=1905334 RepID=UPI002A367ECC|nr:type II secretion system F family protein [Thauera sp.]MDX9884869.1 type II secretion system F family protein [Thauera sp.]